MEYPVCVTAKVSIFDAKRLFFLFYPVSQCTAPINRLLFRDSDDSQGIGNVSLHNEDAWQTRKV